MRFGAHQPALEWSYRPPLHSLFHTSEPPTPFSHPRTSNLSLCKSVLLQFPFPIINSHSFNKHSHFPCTHHQNAFLAMPSSRSPSPPSPSDKHALLDEKIYPTSRLRLRFSWWPVLGAICFIALLVNLAVFKQNRHVNEPTHVTYADRASWLYRPDGIEKFHKPREFKIIALVFYGRKDRVSILDCYLKVNLSSLYRNSRTNTHPSATSSTPAASSTK
jgi:hypothetical protein